MEKSNLYQLKTPQDVNRFNQINGLSGLAGLAGQIGSWVPAIRMSGVDDWVADAATRWALERKTPMTFGVDVLEAVYAHRVAYPAAGTVAELQFFNVNQLPGVTNWFGPNGTPPNHIFMVDGIGFTIEVGKTAANAFGATPAQAIVGTRGLLQAVALQRVYEDGVITFGINSTEYINRIGLNNFPVGSGAVAGAVFSIDSDLAAGQSYAQISNGVPARNNRPIHFPRPIPIGPNQPVNLKVRFGSLIPIDNEGNGDSTIRAEMYGHLVRFS